MRYAHRNLLIVEHSLTGTVPVCTATGTVKTSMDHPTAGKTQMFRRDLDDAGFQQVLENPRSHTGQVSSKQPLLYILISHSRP